MLPRSILDASSSKRHSFLPPPFLAHPTPLVLLRWLSARTCMAGSIVRLGSFGERSAGRGRGWHGQPYRRGGAGRSRANGDCAAGAASSPGGFPGGFPGWAIVRRGGREAEGQARRPARCVGPDGDKTSLADRASGMRPRPRRPPLPAVPSTSSFPPPGPGAGREESFAAPSGRALKMGDTQCWYVGVGEARAVRAGSKEEKNGKLKYRNKIQHASGRSDQKAEQSGTAGRRQAEKGAEAGTSGT